MYKLLYADEKGRMFDHDLAAVGRTGNRLVEIIDEDMIELPEGASLMLLPDSAPVGMNNQGEFKLLEFAPGDRSKARAVGALLPQGYTRTLLPGYRRKADRPLPLYGYTAVAFRDDKVFVAAMPTDDPDRWDPKHYNSKDLPGLVQRRLNQNPENRVLAQLARCALDYGCFTAQNIFYTRWEGGLPMSPVCNARCLGCISLQPAECCPSPQSRLTFRPTVEEATQIALHHLYNAPDAIISFGQGCEGEPALAADDIARVVGKVRQKINSGTININSNAGYTRGIEQICNAGLNSIRVSLISARDEVYNAYYRPRDYSLADVARSIRIARSMGVYVSLNLLVLPGLNDTVEETNAIVKFIESNDINKVQLRNLNIDPDLLGCVVPTQGEIIGIPQFVGRLRSITGLEIGNYSRPVM